MDKANELAALPGLGSVSAGMLIEAGVPDARSLRRLGPKKCFQKLRFRFGKRVTTNFIYALETAIREIDWRLLEAERKAELRNAAREIVRSLEQTR